MTDLTTVPVPKPADGNDTNFRALATELVAGFPPLSREQAALVRTALLSGDHPTPDGTRPSPQS